MAKTGYQSIDAYIAAQPEAVRPALEEVRAAIRRALPGALELISYQIPAYRLDGKVVIYFAGWTKHFSLYPVHSDVVEALRDALEPYDVNDKGTVRFPLDQPVPVELIERIAKLRARQAKAEAPAKR